jgi:pantetheine-phosphate adenylyltransferase
MTAEQRIAIYPGSFDPITLGHEDIARRALRVADRVLIAVAHTASQKKQGMFTTSERLAMIAEVFGDEPRVAGVEFSGLLVDFAREQGATVIVRGMRGMGDFEYKTQIALMNRAQHPTIETIFMVPEASRSFISASLVREISSLGGDVSGFVPTPVLSRIREKLVTPA